MSFIFALLVGSSQVASCEDPSQLDWQFIGCRPSPGECYYSCPSLGSYIAEVDEELCPWEWDSWACYCSV